MKSEAGEDRRQVRVGPTIAISGSLLALTLSVAVYVGSADQRLKNVEGAVADIRLDMKDLSRTVGRIEVRTAAMDRRSGIEDPVAARTPIGR